MEEKFEVLSKTQKKLLVQLSVFGNEETSLTSFVDFYGIIEDDEKNSFFESIYDLASQEFIVLSKEKFKLDKNVEKFLFEKYPPNINNCRVFVEFFLDLLHPPVENIISTSDEMMLHKVISRIQGSSSDLAMLTDFYAQYLLQQEDLKSAISFFLLAIEIHSKINSTDVMMCSFYNHLSEAYMADSQFDKAIDTAFKSVHLVFNLPRKDQIVLVYSYSLISTTYFRKKNYKLSYEYSLKSIEIAEENDFDQLLLSNLFYEASISATKAKENEQALNFINKSYKAIMSLPNEKRNEKLIEKIRLHNQYLNLMKKVNNSVIKFVKPSYIYILLIIILLLVVILFLV